MSLTYSLQCLEMEDVKDFEVSPEELELTKPRVKENIKAHLEILRGSNFVRVQGTVEAIIITNCSRCLEEILFLIRENFKLDYILGRDPYALRERVELKDEDIDRVYFQGDTIDLGIGIRETIVLATPIAPLCRQDCSGICPRCGKNLNQGKCECK